MKPRQQKFVAALFQYPTIKAAAAACGVTDRTARNWLNDPDVITAIRDAEAETLSEITRNLLRLSGKAGQALEGAMDDGDAPHGVKIRAADLIYTRMLQYLEKVTLEERVKALEEGG